MAYDRIRDEDLTLEELLQELRKKSREFDIEVTGSQLTGLNVFDLVALQIERIFQQMSKEAEVNKEEVV